MINKEPTIKQISEVKDMLDSRVTSEEFEVMHSSTDRKVIIEGVDQNGKRIKEDVYVPEKVVTKTEIQDCITKTKSFIKQLRASAKEQNNRADELAKSNGVLVKQLKQLKHIQD